LIVNVRGYLPRGKETPGASAKLAVFSTGPAIRSTWSNLLCDTMGAAVLIFGALAIPSSANLSGPEWAPGFGPLIVGLLVFAIGLSLGGPTGYSINPTREFGPRLMHAILPIAGKGGSDWRHSWIPVVGPILGGVMGAWAYRLL
jgi:glycerol uptake facilitator protein